MENDIQTAIMLEIINYKNGFQKTALCSWSFVAPFIFVERIIALMIIMERYKIHEKNAR